MDLKQQEQLLENLTLQQKEIIGHYHENNMALLRKICDPIISRKGVPQMEWDELYDVASDTLLESLWTYDESKGSQFKTYLTGNINRAFYDWTRDNRRGKRCNVERDEHGRIKRDKDGNPIIITNISLNWKNEEGIEFGESLDSGFNIENELTEEIGISNDSKMDRYLEKLSKKQRQIVTLLSEEYKPSEIREELHITEKEYSNHMMMIKSYENISILF